MEGELIVRHQNPKNPHMKPWWSLELSKLRKDLRKALKYWQGNKSNPELKNRYTHCQHKFDKMVRQAKRQFVHRQQWILACSLKSNPKQFWKRFDGITLRGQMHTSELPDSVTDSKGVEQYEKGKVLCCWKEYFSTLLRSKSQPLVSLPIATFPHPVVATNCELLNCPISFEEVSHAVMSLNNSKSPGVDEIRADFIKNNYCISFLHKLFNLCFDIGRVPFQWAKSIIKPIPKSTQLSKNPQDYRGISLQSTVLKAFCSILGNRLTDFCETHNLLVDEQNGFRKDRNCIDHIFALCGVVEERLNHGNDTFVCFVDLRKAFDSVNRDLLWHKLKHFYGIEGKFLAILQGMYEEVLSCVRVNRELSDWFTVESGVKQGCILSPILFGLFINDLAHHINKLDVGLPCGVFLLATLMFADDIVLIAENEFKLQCLLDVLHEWCVNWEVQINPRKTVKSERPGHCTVSLVVLTHLPTLRSISTLVLG